MHMMSSSLCALQKRLDAFEPVFLMSGVVSEHIYQRMDKVLGILEVKADDVRIEYPEGSKFWAFTFGTVRFEVTLNNDCTYAVSGYRSGQMNPAVKDSESFDNFKRVLLAKAKDSGIDLPPLYDKKS
jgi:hypothetical protein